MKISREEFKKQIRARRLAKEAISKYARLQTVAEKYPRHFSAAIVELANSFHEIGEGLHTMNENLGLSVPSKTASLEIRVAAAKIYGNNFRLIATENPEELAGAINEIYSEINSLAEGIENLAENAGVELVAPMESVEESHEEELAEGHTTLEGPEFIQEELQEAEEAAEAGDMEEAAEEAHDAEEAAEVVTAGSEGWVNDRDENGQPKAPKEASKNHPLFMNHAHNQLTRMGWKHSGTVPQTGDTPLFHYYSHDDHPGDVIHVARHGFEHEKDDGSVKKGPGIPRELQTYLLRNF
jgi:hypothetical protein